MTRLLTTFSDGVCRAELTEPEKLNPLGEEVRKDIETLVRRLDDDDETRVVVFSGAGRAFSAGADLRGGGAPTGAGENAGAEPRVTWARRRRRGGAWQRTLDGLERVPQVTVARLHGRVIGGAVLLAAACDVRVASDDVLVSIPEVALGIPLTWAGLPRLVREVGLPRTRDLVMTGRPIDGPTALAWGFVTRLVSVDRLDPAIDEIVAELIGMPDAPLRMTKDALYAIGRDHPSHAASWADPDLITWSGREVESREAAARYLQRIARK